MRVLVVSRSDRLALCAVRCLEVIGVRAWLSCPQRYSPSRLSHRVEGYLADPGLMSPGVDMKAARLIADHYRSLGIDMLIPVDTAGILVARLAQSFLPGMLTFPMLAHDGEVLAWTLQEHTKTGGLLFTSNHRVLELGKSIMSATGFTGLAHFDLMRDSRNGEVKMLECNPRLWGTVRDSMLYGVNFLQLGMDLAMGREVRCSSDHPDLLCSGPYDLLKRILAGRRGWREINHPSLQGFVQVLKDPLPYLCFELQNAAKKRSKVRAGDCRYQ